MILQHQYVRQVKSISLFLIHRLEYILNAQYFFGAGKLLANFKQSCQSQLKEDQKIIIRSKHVTYWGLFTILQGTIVARSLSSSSLKLKRDTLFP